jgi:cell division protein FtsI/penicillin-binding protein 2
MKNLTVASALDLGIVTAESNYNDLSYVEVDGLKITNAAKLPAGTRTMYDILRYSLNSGAVYLLELMGGGEINQKARETWHDYLYNHYRFGQPTGIEQTGEAKGIVPDPNKGQGLNIQFANTSFGQGIAITPIQMVAAQASIFNGGTYYQPTLIESTIDGTGKEQKLEPRIIRENVVSKNASTQVVSLLEQYIINTKQAPTREGFRIGGKTGTAQIPDETGGYKEDFNIGTYAGFIGGKEIEYAILVTVTEPKVPEFAGFYVARPIYNTIIKNMMDLVTFQSK